MPGRGLVVCQDPEASSKLQRSMTLPVTKQPAMALARQQGRNHKEQILTLTNISAYRYERQLDSCALSETRAY